MKKARKRIGSLLLSMCMVLTMLPTVAFAEEDVRDSGTPSSTSEITVFEDLAENVSLQEVESGTSVDELNLPNTLTATVTTSSATTVTENVYSITVSGWTSNPEYNSDYDPEGTNSYVFTPTLDLPEGVTLADGVEPPTITVTVTIDTSGLVETIEKAGLIATVSENTVTVTGEATGSKITFDIGEGITVVWNATYTCVNEYTEALNIKGTGTFRIIGGKITESSNTPTMFVSNGSPLVIINGGEDKLNSGTFTFIFWTASGGRLVYLSGSIVGEIEKNSSSSVIAYYSEETFTSKFSSWTKGSNLLPLKDVVLTQSDGNAYSYESDTTFVGTVTAMLPDVFDLSGATITPSISTTDDYTVNIKGNSVIFSGTLNAADLTLTVLGAKVGGTLIDDFTTPEFGVNITPFIPVTDITDVPTTLEGDEPLQLSGTVKPTNATKQEIVWSIKDEGGTGASITDSMLSATHTGTVTVTATITDGITYGTDYTQDFNIDVTISAALSIDPVSCTFDPLEEEYGYASPKTITVTNTGNTMLTGVNRLFIDEYEGWYTYDDTSWTSSLAPNESAQITIKPYSNLLVGTYKSTLKISSDQGVEASVPISLTVTEMAPRLRFGGTDVHKLDADFSGTGYSWNAGIKTLTLTSDYAAGQIDFMYCDAETMTLKLAGDVTIDEHETSQAECIYSSGNLTIDLGGHTLTLMTGGDNYSALDGDTLMIQNGTLVARLIGSDTEYEIPSIDAGLLTVGNATVTADADSLNYGGIYTNRLTLKQGAKIRTCGAIGLDFSTADSFDLESDDISLTAIGSTYAIYLDADLSYPPGSALRSWTNTDITPPSFTDAGTLLSSKTRDEWEELWVSSKYVYIGTNTPEAVITGISVKSNPNKLIYNEGNKLDLTGLAANLTYSDATTKEVPYTDFVANSISMTYADGGVVAQGDTLSTVQNGKAIVLMVGSYTAQTNALTVNAIPKYSVTVTNGTGNGEYAEGASVTIIANTPDSGKRFKEWTVVSGGVTLANAQATSTTFTMPANAVEITATYEDIPAGVTPVTGVTLNKSSLSLYSNTSTKTATLTATITPADATDKLVIWQSSNTSVATVDERGLVTAVGNGTAVITVITIDGGYTASCTVKVSTYTSGGGSGGGSSSGGSSSTNTTTTTENQPNQPITAVVSVTATVGTNGTASASIPDTAVTDAIAKAQAEAKKQGKTANGVSIELNVTMPKGATTLTATLSRNTLNSLVSAGVTNLTINGSPVTVVFDQKALKEIQKQSSGNVNITIAPKVDLSETAKAIIGSRPVYSIIVGYGNNRTVSSFGDGVATVAIPYASANGEAIGGLYAVYVDENGNATRVAGSAYDANSGCVIFTTTHFSMYGVGYTAPSAKFTDINNHWAKEYIDYVVGRGLFGESSKTTFSPDRAMVRGMLVTALGRLAGADVSSYKTSSFTDVAKDQYYTPYIEWAYKKGIIQGIGNNQFAPDRAITREEIAVIFANYAKATGYTLPVTREATTYADASSIGSNYKTAVTAMQQAGIMMGGTSNKFNPKSNATRAEVSSMLHRYIKLTIDPDTAQGWTFNDAGQWLYYKEGKVLTGTQTIDGLKYFFYSNGALQTGWVKDGNNWRYYSGNKAIVGWYDIGDNGNNKTYYFNKDGIMMSGKWLEINDKWYYFYADGSLAKSTKIDDYEVDENGARKTK